MVHTVIINGRSYDLPKKTLTVAGRLDEVLRVDETKGLSLRQKFEKLHNFSKDVLGEENTTEILGTDSLDDIDLSELAIAVRCIIDAYDRPVAEYQMQKNREKLSGLPLKQLESITKAAEVARFERK